MHHLLSFLHYAVSFALVISIIVFVHEFGHFIVARLCGVRVEVFSIGFGHELIGFTDRYGTRWKLAALPLGGYVKMFGDASAVSAPDAKALLKMSKAEQRFSFHHRPLWAKAAIVSAGPLFNFLLAILVFTYFIFTVGIASTEPVVGSVLPHTPAAIAGLRAGDRIVAFNDKPIRTFNQITDMVATNLGTPVVLQVERGKKTFDVTLTPKQVTDKDAIGNVMKHPLIGLKSKQVTYKDANLPQALWLATSKTYDMCASSLKVLGQMVAGHRSTDELRGPLGIAKLSGEVTERGDTLGETVRMFLWFIALLSVNLGLVNLFPIPILDGGHLLFYVVEALRGRPLAERFQEYSYRFGFVFIAGLMALSLLNDVRQMF